MPAYSEEVFGLKQTDIRKAITAIEEEILGKWRLLAALKEPPAPTPIRAPLPPQLDIRDPDAYAQWTIDYAAYQAKLAWTEGQNALATAEYTAKLAYYRGHEGFEELYEVVRAHFETLNARLVAAVEEGLQDRFTLLTEQLMAMHATGQKIDEHPWLALMEPEWIPLYYLFIILKIRTKQFDVEKAGADFAAMIGFVTTPDTTQSYFTYQDPGSTTEKVLADTGQWLDLTDGSKAPLMPEQVVYYPILPIPAAAEPPLDVGPDLAKKSPEAPAFIYMDVGCWIGGTKNGAAVAGSSKQIHREFGVIYQNVSAVCSYRHLPKGASTTKTVTAAGAEAGPRDVVNDFLGTVGTSGNDVYVLRDLALPTPNYTSPTPDSEPIYVIVGDMHLPIIQQKTTDAKEATYATMPQMGRFDIGDATYRSMVEYPDAWKSIVEGIVAAEVLFPVLTPVVFDLATGIPPGPTPQVFLLAQAYSKMTPCPGEMHCFSINDWLTKYRVGDIFEDAGQDLFDFVERLEQYNKDAAAASPKKPPIYLVQTGDMYDLWIGLLCHFQHNPGIPPSADDSDEHAAYEYSPAKDQPGSVLKNTIFGVPEALKCLEYWVLQTMNDTLCARGVTRFQMFPGEKCNLFGNHDSYFAPSMGLSVKVVDDMCGGTKYSARKSSIEISGIFAEHGHQPDPYARDGSQVGWAMTQGCFEASGVRYFAPSARGMQMKWAADRWIIGGGKFNFYVNGHTHMASLCEVVLKDHP